jgi:2,3,4,5-tetrahydropyridine-2-carboxylate N-succinyltransferase
MTIHPAISQFTDNLERMTAPCPTLGVIKVSLDGAPIRTIANIPGQSGSLRVLASVQLNGTIDKKGIAAALEVFAPLIPETRECPVKHPTIDLLLGLSEDQILSIDTVTTSENLFAKLLGGNATADEKHTAVMLLDCGLVRCAEKLANYQITNGRVVLTGTHTWVPQTYAVACMNAAFSAYPMQRMGEYFYDKVPLKTEGWAASDFERAGVRFIPGSFVRRGAYLGSGTTVMPGGIVNTGAYVAGGGVMIDGGARVATGAQIGKGVKLGAGSGVEGILEPPGRLPSIIEDNVRVGANCELMGIVEEGAVIASGVVMASGKKIFDLRTNSLVEPRYMAVGETIFEIPVIPANRVAVGGVYLKEGTRFGTDCILLLEKDASETSLAQLPKNSELYISV